jgi:hypothetical protein
MAPWRAAQAETFNSLPPTTNGRSPFDTLRAASQPSTAAGLDPTNCGPQVLIAAITVTAIRNAVITTNVDHV